MASNKDFQILLNQYTDGNISEEDFKAFMVAVNKTENIGELMSAMDAYWNEETKEEYVSEEQKETIYSKLISGESFRKPKIVSLWYKISAAAVLFFIIGGSLFVWNEWIVNPTPPNYASDIRPGKAGATLTLANGKKINLNTSKNGDVALEAGVVITKSAEGELIYKIIGGPDQPSQMNTLSTANGETYKVILPDGSQVWLNAASKLSYYTNMDFQGKRLVKMEGEGYFEVAKDKEHPFIVESSYQQVEVMGTHFNVNAYPGEGFAKTTLVEGSVKVSSSGLQKNLSPGFEALNSSNGIQIHEADTELATAWKDGKLVFEDQKIQSIMKSIARWYNVEVVYHGEMPEDLFRGSASRFENVSQVLGILESTGRVHFEIEGRKIYVSK